MPDSTRFLKPEVVAKLRGIDLKARLVVEGFLAGLHRSPYKGFSVEFTEHRGLSGTLTVLHHPKCINGLGRLMVELTERMMTADGVSILDSRFQIVD